MRRLLLLSVCALAMLGPFTAVAMGAGQVGGSVSPVGSAIEVKVCVVGTTICTIPEAGGQYSLSGVPFGGVKISFTPSYRSGLLTQYYDHKSGLGEAATVVLTSTAPSQENVNADLIEGGTVEGVVEAAAVGGPLAEVEACAISTTGASFCTETDSLGAYEIHSLPAGFYTVRFWGSGKSAEYAPGAYVKPPATSPTSVSVLPGTTLSEIDGALVKGARIDGVVTEAPGGTPLAGVEVCLFAISAKSPERCAATVADGGYAFQGLLAGTYQVGFSLEPAETGGLTTGEGSDGFESQFYAGSTTRAAATPILLVGSGVATGVNATLVPPPPPPASLPLPPVLAPIVAAPPTTPVPAPRQITCKKGLRKKKVKGSLRCVNPKPTKHKPRNRRKVSHKQKGSKQ